LSLSGTLGVTGATTLSTVNGWNFPFASGTTKGSTWPALLGCKTDGVTEIGKYLDFHLTSADTADNAYRITCTAASALTLGGTVTISRASTLAALTTSGTLTSNGTTALKNTTVTGTLGVTGASTLAALTTSGTLTSNRTNALKNSTVTGTLDVTGMTHLVDTIVTENFGVKGWMVLNGNFSLGLLDAMEISAGIIKARQSLTVPSGNVETLLAAKANSNHTHSTYAASSHTHTSFNALSLTGTTTVAALTASGAVTLNGTTTTKNVQVNGALNVTGDIKAANLLPKGYVLITDGDTRSPENAFGGTWLQVGIDGIYTAEYNAFTDVHIYFHGRMANCQIFCLNFGRGDNVTYNLNDWGLCAYRLSVPIHVTYTQWNSGNYLYVDSSAWRVTINPTANSINVDSRYGNASMKPDYMLEFNSSITDMNKVMTLPVDDKRIYWRRQS
jgi:hypothetical protein